MYLNKQDSEHASGLKYAKYGKILNVAGVLNMRALHSVLNMPEYTLTKFWIYLGLNMSEYRKALNIQELHRVLNTLQYGLICLNRTWICLNMSEFTIIDRVLNMYQIIHNARSLYKLMSTFWEIDLFRTWSKI